MKHKTHVLIAIASSFLIGAATGPNLRAQSESTTELVVRVSGLTSQIGSVQVAVFDSEEQWLATSLREEVLQLDTQPDLQVTFSLPPGEYAVVVVHDLNNNGEHDVNLFGKPVEPFGFSNNVSHLFSAPSWEEAMVSLSSESMTIEIQLETR